MSLLTLSFFYDACKRSKNFNFVAAISFSLGNKENT